MAAHSELVGLPVTSFTDTHVVLHDNQDDTLAEWLRWRFARGDRGGFATDEDERSYWEHEAKAVRRAVARGGFRKGGEDNG